MKTLKKTTSDETPLTLERVAVLLQRLDERITILEHTMTGAINLMAILK